MPRDRERVYFDECYDNFLNRNVKAILIFFSNGFNDN